MCLDFRFRFKIHILNKCFKYIDVLIFSQIGSLSASFTKTSQKTAADDNDIDSGDYLIDVIRNNHTGRFAKISFYNSVLCC